MKHDFEYLQESFLVNNLYQLEFGMSKSAGLLESLNLDSVGSSIKSFVADKMKNADEVPGGYFTSILNIMAPAVITRANPILGVIYLIGSEYGFSLEDMVIKLANHFRTKIDNNQPISGDEITSAGKSLLGLSAEASLINEIEYFIKEAQYRSQYRSQSDTPKIPFLIPEKGGSLIQKVFGNLFKKPGGKSKIKWFLGGFAIWIVKTIFAGAGLLALSSGVSSLLGHKKPETETLQPKPEEQNNTTNEQPQPQPQITQTQSQKPAAPKSNKMWVVPLVGDKSIQDTLRIWTLDIYPELKQYTDINNIIRNCPAFNSIVNILRNPKKMGRDSLVMPEQFTSRKQVVDQFIDDVKGLLK